MTDQATINTRRGPITATRISADRIEGTSPAGNWDAFLPLNGRTEYSYPADDTGYVFQGQCRKAVARLVA